MGIQAMGVPVVSVIHHPLHIDREADFTIDPSLKKNLVLEHYEGGHMFYSWERSRVAFRDSIAKFMESAIGG